MKKALAITLAIIMCMGILAACGGNENQGVTPPQAIPSGPPASGGNPSQTPTNPPAVVQPAPVEPDVVFADHIEIIIDNNRPSSVNPLIMASNVTPSHWSFILMYDRLLNYNEKTGEFLPGLAKSWQSADFKTYTFDLRDDVYFHNGDKFTAQDVVNTIDLAKENAPSMMANQWSISSLESYTAISDYKLELVLSSVNVDYYMNLVQPQASVLNKRAVEADADFGMNVGTGAFILKEFVTNDYLTLERNDKWWNNSENGGAIVVPTKSMTLRFIPEVSARTTMMLNGEVQACFSISSEDYGYFENDDYSIFPLTMNNPQGFSFNMANNITSDKNFRLAVLSAINREEIATVAAGDWAQGLTNTNGGESIWGFATEFRKNDIPVVPQDIEKAKEYLAASVYNGERIEITAAVSTNIKASEMFQQQLLAIGINAYINETDTAGLNAQFFTPDHHIIFHGFTFTYAAGSSRALLVPGMAQNRASYENPEVTQLISEALTMTDRAAREKHYIRVQELVAEDLVYINMLWRLNGIVGCKGLGGMILPSDTHSTDLRGIYWIIDQ